MADKTFIDTEGNQQLVIDGDTLTNETGKRYRIDGLDALETDKLVTEDGKRIFKRGDYGGDQQLDAIAKVIKEGNFNKMNYSGEIDKSKGEREIIGLSNPQGDDLVDTLYRSGLAKVNEYTSAKSLVAKEEGDLIAALYGDDRVPYRNLGNEFNNYINGAGKVFKTRAINESQYNPEIHSGVQFRDPNRTIDNQADGVLSSAGVAFDIGWEGVKEGLWGYADALGQVTGLEMLENIGEAGVARSRERIADMPQITLDYQEVDGVRKGFEYMLNNTAMMIPQMLTLFGSMAVAAPVAALGAPAAAGVIALAPISLISAGQTWNEMEGEKGVDQFIGASMTGVGIAMLERFGLQKLIKPADILTQAGKEKVIRAMALKPGMDLQKATKEFNGTLRQEIGKYSKDLAVRFDAEDFRGLSFKELGKRAATGFGVEAGTEIAQEGLQMTTANLLAENEYSSEQVKHRLINAGLAGGTVGSALSFAGNLSQQGKRSLLSAERVNQDAERFNLMENEKRERTQANMSKGRPAKGLPNTDGYMPDMEEIIDSIPTPREKKTFNYEDNKNLATKLHNDYKTTQKGITNYFKNNQDLFEYISSAGKNLSKLVLAQEKNMATAEKLVKQNWGLKLFHMAGAETTGHVFEGGNYKESNDLINGAIASKVDERSIANLFGQKKLTNKNINIISAQIKDFSTPKMKGNKKVGPSDFELYDAMMYSKARAFRLAKILFDPESSVADVAAAEKGLKDMGFLNKKRISAYYNLAKKYDPENGFIDLGLPMDQEQKQMMLYTAAKQFQMGYDKAFSEIDAAHQNETGQGLRFDNDYWWKHRGFDWEKVKGNRSGFFNFLKNNTDLNEDERSELYESIVRDGQGNINTSNSLVQGKTYMPYSISNKLKGMTASKDFNEFASDNMFEAFRRDRLDAAKYASTTNYFGHGGRKLNYIFSKIIEENKDNESSPNHLSLAEIEQMAYYTISMINSTHGNFNKIESKRVAAVNSFLTGWSILAGLPMAMISSIPETPLIYFNVKNDVEFNAATKQLINQIGGIYDAAIKAEVEQTERLLKRINQSTDTNSVVDRLASGERDVSFLKMHEAFFSGIGLTKITQFQRRMNAGLGVDFIKSGFSILSLAPKKTIKRKIQLDEGPREITETLGFDFDKFQDIEMRTYNQLSDLGFDVERMVEVVSELDQITRDNLFDMSDQTSLNASDPNQIKNPSERAIALRKAAKTTSKDRSTPVSDNYVNAKEAAELQLYIDEKMDLALYRYVKERVQLPSSANRPLAFQDPHYQLIFQFNGFLSTFTGNLVPKIWNSQLRKGNPKVKYDTFALVVTMIALGAASQYLKDLAKFGGKTPYLDEVGLVQRAIFSSGVLGQYERVIDAIHPLYPDRSGSDRAFNLLLGELGPSVRNVGKVVSAAGLALEGETERGLSKALGATPFIGPFTGTRNTAAGMAHGKMPDVSIPSKNEILDALLS